MIYVIALLIVLGLIFATGIWAFWGESIADWYSEYRCGGHQFENLMENGQPAITSDNRWILHCRKCGKREVVGHSSRH